MPKTQRMKTTVIPFFLMLATLWSCKEEPVAETTEIVTLMEATTSWDGAALPPYPEGDPKITILKITIPPGTELAPHIHPVINSGVLLKGELTVTSEQGKTVSLKAGDALVELVHTVHYGKNEGSVPAEIIVFYAGTEGTPTAILDKE